MMRARWGPLSTAQGRVGLTLLVLGQALILIRTRPFSDFYFPLVWLGYVLFLDGTLFAHTGRSLYRTARATFLLLFPLSVGFWWLFEFFNLAVHNWSYVGAGRYTGAVYVLFASLDFSLVLVAVWNSARFISLLFPRTRGKQKPDRVPAGILWAMMAAGVVSLILPVVLPRYFFGLIWVSLLFLLDPINNRLGRPSMVLAVWNRNWRLPLAFALGALMCGFLWETWNFWSMPKWIYHIPYVGFWHVFEMPLLGWTGYLPFGLELFAMTNFVLAVLGLPPMGLESPGREMGCDLPRLAPGYQHAFQKHHQSEEQHA